MIVKIEKELPVPIPSSCHGCGSCCRVYDSVPVADNDPYVPAEWTMPSDARIVDRGQVSHREMKLQTVGDKKFCAALDNATGACTIYNDRPLVCRDFNRGSYNCALTLAMDKKKLKQWETRDQLRDINFDHIPQSWVEVKEYSQGCRRSKVDGVWTPWACFGCKETAQRIGQIKHLPGCRDCSIGLSDSGFIYRKTMTYRTVWGALSTCQPFKGKLDAVRAIEPVELDDEKLPGEPTCSIS